MVEMASVPAAGSIVGTSPARASMEPLPASLATAPHLAPAVAAMNDLAMIELAMTGVKHDQLFGGAAADEGPNILFVCKQFDVSHIDGGHFVGFEPVVALAGAEDVVHHMNIFRCDDAIGNKFAVPGECGDISSVMHPTKGPCKELLTAYDKGASGFTLPEGFGVSIGNDRTPFTRIVLQIHYLFPDGGFKSPPGPLGKSGIRMLVTPTPQPHEAGVMGWIDYSLGVPPGVERYEVRSECPAQELVLLLENDMVGTSRGLTPLALHLHAHDSAMKMVVEHHSRRGDVVEEYMKIDPYHGYGDDESFKLVPTSGPDAPRKFLPGDRLLGRCWFNSTWTDKATQYGVDHGDEMCGFIMYYFPHDPMKTSSRWQLCQTYQGRGGRNEVVLPSN